MRLKDKVAIITGGSRGIGFATADAFLREGAKVAVAASSEKNAEAAVEKLKAIHPDAEVVGISPNLGSFESVKEEFDKVEKQFGRIDILVNNAGVSERVAFPIEEALILLESRNLKNCNNMYMNEFKQFINIAKEINA